MAELFTCKICSIKFAFNLVTKHPSYCPACAKIQGHNRQKANQLAYYYRQKKHHSCPDCGKAISGKDRRCNRCAHFFHRRPEHLKYLGIDKRMNRNGHILINVGGKWMPEHRYLWEKHYGQIPLGWNIHHLDGDKTNNSPENLYACSISDHHSPKFMLILQKRISALQRELVHLKSANQSHLL